MRVLIMLKRSPEHRYLVNLFTKALIDELRDLIRMRKHSQAVEFTFRNGIVERQVVEEDLSALQADLILSETNARWDLTCS